MAYVKCINICCSNCKNDTCLDDNIRCPDRDMPIMDFVDEPSHSIYEEARK